MKKIIKFLLDKYIMPILVFITVTFLTSIISKIKEGSWIKYFSKVPIFWWIIFISVILVWILGIIIYKRVNKIKDINTVPVLGVSVPAYGWMNIGELEYENVVWIVQVPAPPPYERIRTDRRINSSSIDIDTNPRCPNCKTELIEEHSFFWWYTWDCVSCDFKTKSTKTFIEVAKRAKKVAKRKVEIENKSETG